MRMRVTVQLSAVFIGGALTSPTHYIKAIFFPMEAMAIKISVLKYTMQITQTMINKNPYKNINFFFIYSMIGHTRYVTRTQLYEFANSVDNQKGNTHLRF